jgi:hypothetical protein
MITKNSCILFNRHEINYLTVELGSAEHSEAYNKGYEYRGPAYVANTIEIEAMDEANKTFIKSLKMNLEVLN